MKLKFTIEHTPDETEEVPTPKITKFEMTGESDKDFPFDKFSNGILQVFNLIKGEIPYTTYRPIERPDLSDLGIE